MNGKINSSRLILGVTCWMILVVPWVSAQDIVPVFPANGDTIRFEDLVNVGFEWVAPEAVLYQIRLFGPDPFLSQVPFQSESSPLKLDAYLKIYFPEGAQFSWQIELVDGEGVVFQRSDQFTFTIINKTSLIPTPTPEVWPTPSGDLDGSARVDAPDLFILAAAWIKADGSLRAGDLNEDSVINRQDLFLYRERFGKPGALPFPMSPVGTPGPMYFTPESQVVIAETSTLELHWSTPAYPQAEGFVYDILIIPPYGTNIEVEGITSTSYRPFQTMMTRTGTYLVFLQARLEGVGTSDIVSGQFDIVYFKSTAPTPTLVPQSANITEDSSTNALDVVSFLQTFNTYKGHVNFNTKADLYTDNKIDRQDLLLFQQYYKERDRNPAAPVWLTAEIPVLVSGLPDTYSTVDLQPPYELKVGQTVPQNGLAEAYYSRLSFSPVAGAIDYFVTVRYEKHNYELNFFTGGETSFTEKLIPLGHDDVIAIEVQAAQKGLLLGEKSETLRVIIPPN